MWQFDQNDGFLSCVDCYDRESDGHTQDAVLTGPEFHTLFEVLQKAGLILAPDAGSDDRITELYRVYLQPIACESLLATPIRHHDQTVGSLWFEHNSLSSSWLNEEISFARANASMLALRFSSNQKPISSSVLKKEDTDAAADAAAPTAQTTLTPRKTRPETRTTS